MTTRSLMRTAAAWMKRMEWLRPAESRVDRVRIYTRSKELAALPAEYRGLHKYLDTRYANTVVLTFGQIEDLLGFTLPDLARFGQEWWANADDSSPSPQSCSWTRAGRTATPNLPARNVVFERVSA